MNNTVIQIAVDGAMKTIEDATLEKYIADRYLMAVEHLLIKKDRLEEFIEAIKTHETLGGELEDSTFAFTEAQVMRYIENKGKWFIRATANGSIDDSMVLFFYGVTIEISSTMYKLFKTYEHLSNANAILMTNISMNNQGSLTTNNKSVKYLKNFQDTSSAYYPFLDVNEMFHQFLLSRDKLLMLSGTAGTGKTKIIDLYMKYCVSNPQYFCEECDIEEDEGLLINVAYVKNTDVLASDTFWNHLSTADYDLIILDDVDYILTDRNTGVVSSEDHNRKKFITQFLSYTDGVYNKSTKFIITTNQEIESVDKAILRKGRCFDILQFRPLSNKEANTVWKEHGLSQKDFDKVITDTTILACDLGSLINQYVNKTKKKIKYKNYLLEDNISIIDRVNSKKIKIGK